MGIAALIVVGGFGLALLSNLSAGVAGTGSAPYGTGLRDLAGSFGSLGTNGQSGGGTDISPGYTEVVGQTTVTNTVTMSSTETATTTLPEADLAGNSTGVSQGSPSSGGGLIEFSSDLTIRGAAPQQLASAVSALAYSVGGYVAYQSTYSNSAYVVIRVPSDTYQATLGKVEAMGTVESLTSNSNDVRVQYTDLNATLASLRTEQSALLRLLNQSSTINSTLAVETQLQQVNEQVNSVESQILQTKTLISYATINVTIDQTAQQTLPTMTLSASPRTGVAPLSVTFNALVKGGAQPYVINYNFGDGFAAQGQIVIHTFYSAGNYNVTVGVTDQEGNTTGAWTMIHVTAAPAAGGLGAFFGNVGNLFLNVIEGIVEVAVVVLPIAAVGAAIIIPIQRHGRSQKDVRQSQ